MINEKSFGFWIVIAGLVVMLFISLVSVFRYTSVGDASGAITAAGTVVGGLSKIAATADPGSDVATAIQELIDSITPVV